MLLSRSVLFVLFVVVVKRPTFFFFFFFFKYFIILRTNTIRPVACFRCFSAIHLQKTLLFSALVSADTLKFQNKYLKIIEAKHYTVI